MEEWKEYKLGDVVNILDYKRVPISSKERSTRKGHYPYYGAQGIIDYIDDYIFDGTYLLIAEDGENLKSQKQDVAQLASGKYWVNNHAHIVESNGKCDIRYVCYLLNTLDLSGYITGSAQPKLNQANLVKISITLPSLETQKKIADCLSIFGDKIEVNRRINDNLEQQAQALFKSWFVDFEPFRDQPFVESELGMIPRTWSIQTANDVFEINIGKTPPRKEQEWFSDSNEDNVWVSIADMGSCGMFISDSSEYLTDEAIDRFNIIMVERNTVLLSFKLTVGRIAIADNRLTTNEAIARFILPADYYREFLYLYLKQYKYENLGSTSSIATAVNSKTIKGMKLLMPPTSVISDFSNITKPLFEEIRYTLQESRRLAELRDTLLPRLMSGELSVDGLKGQFAVSPGRCPGSNEHVSNKTAL